MFVVVEWCTQNPNPPNSDLHFLVEPKGKQSNLTASPLTKGLPSSPYSMSHVTSVLSSEYHDVSLILATVDEYARKYDIDRPEHPTAESKYLALDNLLRHVAADIRSGNTPESEFDYVGDSDYIGSVLDGLGVNL